MKIGFRTPSPRKSFSARTTGRVKRSVSRIVNPMYGKKGIGYATDPKRALKNSIYHRTTYGISDINGHHSNKSGYGGDSYSEYNTGEGNIGTSTVAWFSRIRQFIYGVFWIVGSWKIFTLFDESNWFTNVIEFVLFVFFSAIIGVFFVVAGCKARDKEERARIEECNYRENEENVVWLGNKSSDITQKKRIEKKDLIEKSKQHHRSDEQTKANNMNCDQYVFSGRYTKTKKIRRNKIAYVFNGEDPMTVIHEMGYEGPIEYSYKPWNTMSDKQKQYLFDAFNGKYQTNMSVDDASAMIERYESYNYNPANDELFKYAEQVRMPVSYYCTYEGLKSRIIRHLKGDDLLAFYVYCVECELKNQEAKNLLSGDVEKERYFGFPKTAKKELSSNVLERIDLMSSEELFDRRKKLYKIAKQYVSQAGL